MPPDSQRKAQRLNLIVNLLWKRSEGLTTEQLARALGVSQRTIQRDLLDLQDSAYGVPLVREGCRWALLAGNRPLLSALRLNLAEATALVLAARLLQRAADEPNPYVTTALAKLSDILPEPLAVHLGRLLAVGAGGENPAFVAVFEVLAQAWAGRRTVHLRYRPANSEAEWATDFDVYCLEPIAPSFALYALGFAHAREELRTLKLERIVSAALTARPFEVAPSFDARAYLLSGWGIMGGPDRQTVRLRFAPAAVRRLRETRFHPSQQMQQEPGGGCIVTFQVAHPIELTPFVRGWGSLVEVLEPEELRHRIAQDARETAAIYPRHRLPSHSAEPG